MDMVKYLRAHNFAYAVRHDSGACLPRYPAEA